MSQSRHGMSSYTEELESDELITAKEAAEVLGCSKRQIQRMASDLDGKIVGGRWLFSRATVVGYAEERADA
jgi:excisionase family DNA binding protein